MLTALAGLSILIIGDSHLTSPSHLITPLHEALVQQGAQVHTLGVCGSHPTDWLTAQPGTCGGAERVGTGAVTLQGQAATTRPIQQLITQDKADLVVIVMGDTLAAYDKPAFPKAWAWQQVSGLAKAIGATGTPCVWVGPGWGSEGGQYGKTFNRVKLMSSFLAANVAPCSYVDSLTFAQPGEWGTVDGQHFTQSGYRAWSDAIVKALPATDAAKAAKP